MLVALTLSLSLVNPNCTATAESRDMQLAIDKAMHELRHREGCGLNRGETKIEQYELLGRTVYRVTVTLQEEK